MTVLAPRATVYGQQAGSLKVKTITCEGVAERNLGYVRDVLGIRPDDTVTRADIDAGIKRILRTGRFLTASYDLRDSEGGVNLVLIVVERALVNAVLFEGNVQFSSNRLAKSVGVAAGDNIDWFAIRGGQEAVRSVYREAGFTEVVVTFDRKRLEESGVLVYRIEEGVRVRIRKILFEGNSVFDDGELLLQIVSRPAFGILIPGSFDEDRVQADASSLQAYYRDSGYLDARVSFQRAFSDDGEDLTLTFLIAEGTQYFTESITINGNEVIDDAEILEFISSKVDEPIRRPFIDNDVKAIRSKYWEMGYIYVSVKSERVFSDKRDLAQIIFEISEGEQFRVGRVSVRGNARTRDKVVRRALNLYPPDDLFDLNEAKESEKRLQRTQIFESASVYPIGDTPGRRDVVMDVRETQRHGDFIFGLGVTSNSGVVGTVNVEFKNFDITDTPRTWSEFWRLKSFYGGGQRLRVNLQPGTEVNRFRIDFTEPFLMDKPIRFDWSGYLFDRGRDGYDEERIGTTFSFGRRFEKGFLFGWNGEISFKMESAKVDDPELFAAKEIRDDEGSNYLSSVKTTLVRDRTDNFFLPTEGDRLRLSYEQFGVLGGEFDFAKLYMAYTWYQTLRRDKLDRKSVLRLNAEGGVIAGNAPVFERYYAGGTGSMRGFRFRGIGEVEGIDENNIGGDYIVLLGAEYSFPLFAENIRGHVFMDTGTVGSGQYRASIGMGVRIIVDVFGPLPLEFNLAAPVSSDSDDEEQVFSFLIGTLF
jgi:outer membrane protein assembly complex protein YaeT